MHKKILLVDDESSLRRTMTLGLNQRGFDTEPCENGLNALKKLETYVKNNIPLDGIVVDIKLPDINGINLAKIITCCIVMLQKDNMTFFYWSRPERWKKLSKSQRPE